MIGLLGDLEDDNFVANLNKTVTGISQTIKTIDDTLPEITDVINKSAAEVKTVNQITNAKTEFLPVLYISVAIAGLFILIKASK
jgi:hypothetical protein